MSQKAPEGLPPGWLNEAEQICLRDLAEGANVLEIGTFLGRSTVVMARVARLVVTVDPHRGSEEVRAAITPEGEALIRQEDGTYDSLPACMGYLDYFGVRDKVSVIVAPFEQIGPFLAIGAWDLIFVDGDHAYNHAAGDLLWSLFIQKHYPEGRVVLHDYEKTWPDVMRAADDVARDHGLTVRPLAGSLAELAP